MRKIVELKQDRNLIWSNFDGYKLSLDPIPVFRQDVSCPPLKAELNEDQYSLLHYKLFSTQNLLVVDPWARTQSYFCNSLGQIIRCAYDKSKGKPEQQQVVCRSKLKTGERRKHGDYNFSFRFLSEKFCLVCDGIKTLSLFETGDRLKAIEWTLVASCQVNVDDAPDEKNYIIFDSRFDIIQERKQISVVLGGVRHIETCVPRDVSKHFLHLHLFKWTLEDSGWKLHLLDTLEGKGWAYYCAFEPKAESIVISSYQDFKFIPQNYHESENQGDSAKENPQFHGETVEETNDFLAICWSQTNEDIHVRLNVDADKDKNDYNVITGSKTIGVKCSGKVLLNHELFDDVDMDSTTWTTDKHFLQITLIKNTPGLLWTSLLANGKGPKETIGENVESMLSLEQQPIAKLEAAIEDSDLPMGDADDTLSISRFNLPTRAVSHSIITGSKPPMFSTSLRPGFPHALAIRLDNDCSLWLQRCNPSKPDEWSMRHEGNLPAMGYVQASKQQQKFMDCSPDLGYAVIAELHRHVFLYETKYNTANCLRNRNGHKITIGRQHLITLEDAGEILGLSTANSVITLLTEKCVYFFQMES